MVCPFTYPQPFQSFNIFVGYTSVILLHNRAKIAISKRLVELWNICLDKGDTAFGTKPKDFACLQMNMALSGLS
jgi:hypothetical protein